MDNAFKWILIWGGILSVVLFILWPCLALPARVFSKVRIEAVPLHTIRVPATSPQCAAV